MTANTKLTCRGCGCEDLAIDADFGTAAASVALPDVHDHPTERLPFRLSACPVCQLIQLVDLPPLEALRPADQWIRYRDPERHLPDLALAVSQFLPRVDGLILGATYKDEPLLAEFERLGHTSTRVLDREADWQLTDARHGIETIQQRMTPDLARHWKAAHSAPLLFVVRHVLEHAHEMGPFLAACREIVADDGFVLLEVPGCEQELSRGDAGALWEEHVSYFTSTSLRNTLQRHGLRCDLIGNYPYAVEDCLFALARPALGAAVETADAAPGSGAGRDLIHTFREAVSRRRAAYRELNSREQQRGRRLALLGAGHRTATAAEILQLAGIVDCVIDDAPEKQGRFLPGSGLPILPAKALVSREIGLCVSMINPDITRRIAEREREYAERDGRFLQDAAVNGPR